MRQRWICANCGHAQRKALNCQQCGMPAEKVTLEFTSLTIGMWVCVSFWVLSLVVVFTLLGRGIPVVPGVGVILTLMLAFLLSFWDDDWMDKEAKKTAEVKRANATRCSVCRTALLLDDRTMRWFCPRCKIEVVSFEAPTTPPPPID